MAASNTRFTQNSLGQSKNPIDSDHGIYRYSGAASSSRCSAGGGGVAARGICSDFGTPRGRLSGRWFQGGH